VTSFSRPCELEDGSLILDFVMAMHSGVMEGEERDRDNLLRWRHYGTVPVCNKLTGDEIKTLKQSEKL